MAHYTGPKGRINRRLGLEVYDSRGAIKAFQKRQTRPGAHPWRRGKLSEYGLALTEKQKVKHYYGLSEKQLRRFFDMATRQAGNQGLNLLNLCERRLDNIVWRAGFAATRYQARQSVAHGHFFISGQIARTPSQLVRMGDVVRVRQRDNLQKLYRERVDARNQNRRADFIELDPENLEFRLNGLPSKDDCLLSVEIDKVVEFLNR